MSSDIPEPWKSFLEDIDSLIDQQPELAAPIDFHCVGGFVVAMSYALQRATNDLDVFEIVPADALKPLIEKAGRGSEIALKHRVYLDANSPTTTLPVDYQSRLTELFPGSFKNLRLLAVDPYDLALSKLERNIDRDVEDVQLIAMTANLDVAELKQRYETELRPYITGPVERHDSTLKLWIDIIVELQAAPRDGR